jgi:DNA-binding CsgD family transcriptional regulator
MRPIRGRSVELTEIDALTASLLRGCGGVLIVEGPAGIGKTRLLQEVIARAGKAGARPLVGEAFEYQQTVPFAPLFTAFLRSDPPIGDPELLRHMATEEDSRYWVMQHLQGEIAAAASARPLIVAIDDIHWADNVTLWALRSLTAGLADAAVLWLLTARTGITRPELGSTVTALQSRNARILRLGPVEPDAVADIVQDTVRAKADPSLLNLARRAHGNPFLLTELINGLAEEERIHTAQGFAIATGEAPPQRLTDSMQERLDRLAPLARQVIHIAAVLPDRFSAGLVGAMLQRPATDLIAPLAEAIRADLLVEDGDQLSFRHDMLRQATRQSLGSLLRALERQAATVLLEAGAAPTEVARLLERSAQVGDRVAIAALRDAAQFLASSDPSAAADLSKRALELLPARDDGHGAVVAETVVLLNKASRREEAQELAASTISADASPEVEAEIRLRIAAGNEAPQQRVEENRRALELPDIDAVTRARHQAWLAYHQTINGLHGNDRTAINDAAAAAASTGDLESKILCETTLRIVDFADGHIARAVRRMEALRNSIRGEESGLAEVVAAIHWPSMLIAVGRLDEAAAEAAYDGDKARREQNAMALPSFTLNVGMTELAAGRLSAARATIEALPRHEWGDSTEVNMNRMLILAEVAAHTGDRKLMHDMAVEARGAYDDGSPLVSGGAAYVLGLAAWDRQDGDEAVRWLCASTLIDTPLWANLFDQLICRARVAAAQGDSGLRERVVQDIAVLERGRPPVPLPTAISHYARGLLEQDAEALLRAADSLSAWSRPLLQAAATEDAGAALGRIQRPDEAVAALNTAFDIYSSCDAIGDAHRVAKMLRTFGVARRVVNRPRPKTGWDSLTDAELKVVHLIADGATNRAVAQRLHLSPHTVNTHVRNAFGKLGINSRIELRQLVHGSDR